MSSLNYRILALAVLSMVVPTLAPAVTALPGITSTEVDAQILGEYGNGSPFGTWIKRNEYTKFFLHGDCPGTVTIDATGCNDPTDPGNQIPAYTPGATPTFTFDTERGNVNGDQNTIFTDDSQAGPPQSSGASWIFNPGLPCGPLGGGRGVLDDTRLWQFRSSVLTTGNVVGMTITVTVKELDALCNPIGTVTTFDLEDAGPLGDDLNYRLLSGEVSFGGVLGYLLDKGHALQFTFTPNAADYDAGTPILLQPPQSMGVALDDPEFESFIEVYSDSVRVNMWTQDRFGIPQTAFPPALTTTPSQDRQIFLRAIQFDPWGHEEGCDGSSIDLPEACSHDALNELDIRARIQDIDPSHVPPTYCGGAGSSFNPCFYADSAAATEGYLSIDQGLGLGSTTPGLDETYLDCCTTNHPPQREAIEVRICPAIPAINPAIPGCPAPSGSNYGDNVNGLARYHYTFHYPNDQRVLPNGRYQITLEDRNDGWIASVPITIGAGGFDFSFWDSEPLEVINGIDTAAHLVGLRQPTKYKFQVTNNGFRTNDYGFAAPTPGLGWQASVAPNLLTLAPGQTGDVELTVFPAPAAAAGDFKIVSITATSYTDNVAKTLYTKTTVTATPEFGPIEVESLVNLIEIRPELTRVAPFVVRNGGTQEDALVITAPNLPAGWIAHFSPAYLPVFGASIEGFTVSLRAPVEAQPATSFNLVVRVCRAADGSECGQASVPVTIIAIDGIKIHLTENCTPAPAIPVHEGEDCGDLSSYTWHDVETNYGGSTGAANNVPDRGFDASSIYRLVVENTGDRDDDIRFFGSWRNAGTPGLAAMDDSTYCQGSGAFADGVPDGWFYRIIDVPGGGPGPADPGNLHSPDPDAGNTNSRYDEDGAFAWPSPQRGVDGVLSSVPANAFSGEVPIGTLTLPPHTKQYVYVEMGWVVPSGQLIPPANTATGCANQPTVTCGTTVCSTNYRNKMPSDIAQLQFTARSTNDPNLIEVVNLRGTINARTETVGVGGYAFGAEVNYKVKLETGIYQPQEEFVDVNGLGVYNLIARNLGTEYDTLKISVDSGHNGWLHWIEGSDVMSDFVDQGTPMGARPTPHDTATRGCAINAAEDTMICKATGVYEDIPFRVYARAPAGAQAGEYDDMTITVASMKAVDVAQDIFDRMTVRTTLVGDYSYTVDNPDPVKVAYQTQTIAFPFSIRNYGTENDQYAITLVESNPDWNPTFSTGTAAAVPAGFDLHGFLALTVPNDAPITRPGGPESIDESPPEQFIMKVESLSNPGLAFQLNFLAPVVPTPSFILEAGELTIPAGGKDRIQFTAEDPGGNLADLRITGHYRSFTSMLPALPKDWDFICLASTHPHYDMTSVCNDNDLDPCHGSPTCNYPGVTVVPAPFITQLELEAPAARQLGNSRIAHRFEGTNIQGTTEVEKVYVDALINLQSTYGVLLSEAEDQTTRIVPPGNVPVSGESVFKVRVENTGFNVQNVLLTHSNLPGSETATLEDDWSISFDTETALVRPPGFEAGTCTTNIVCQIVNPQDEVVVEVILRAPANAVQGQTAQVVIYGTVQEDGSVSSLTLNAEVGKYEGELTVQPATAYQAPGWTATYTVVIENTGTVEDVMELRLDVPAQLADAFLVTWSTFDCNSLQPVDPLQPLGQQLCFVNLFPGSTAYVDVSVFVPSTAAPTPGSGHPLSLVMRSNLSPTATTQIAPLSIVVLDYVRRDVDGDDIYEYAVDGCTVPEVQGCTPDPSDGYETFLEAEDDMSPIHTVAVDVRQFLSASARDAHTTNGVLSVLVDVDGDGKTDHFLDTDGDALPNVFWSPGKPSQYLPCAVDLTGDGLGEYFVDDATDAAQAFDFAYDMAQAKAYPVHVVFADEGEKQDFAVDLDGSGGRSKGDAIVYGLEVITSIGSNVLGCTGVTKLEREIDMDGKNGLDLVVFNGVGQPLYFLRNNGDGTYQEGAYNIALRDVTGDGVADWVYDHTGNNGSPTAYYDPVTGETGLIDTQGAFFRDLQKYWYVGVLFALVLVLFVVLVFVTRK